MQLVMFKNLTSVIRCFDKTRSELVHFRCQNFSVRRHQFIKLQLFSLLARSQAVARIADCTASQHLRGHAMSSVTWPFDSPYAISYWWSFGTESLNPAVFEILRSKHIGVTSLTFQGHVTSSVTW